MTGLFQVPVTDIGIDTFSTGAPVTTECVDINFTVIAGTQV
jgi:hypothetical protein